MGGSVSGFLIDVFFAVIIFVAGIWLARKLKPLLKDMLINRNVDPMLASFITSITYILLIVFIGIASLSELGIHTTSLVAIVGAAGLAVALSLQNSLSSFAAGVMIIAFRPFRVGDYIEAAGTAGVVEEIQIFFTQLRTGDNKSIVVPNSSIISSNIVNYSNKATRRVDLIFGISYQDDIKQAKQVVHDILKQDERILDNPEPLVAVSQLADSSVNLIVRPWVRTEDYWPVFWDLTEVIKLRFDSEGINIPYPQQDVHIHRVA